MEKVNVNKMVAFRHQLWLEHISVIDEIYFNDTTTFVIDQPSLASYELKNLLNIQPFSVLVMAHEGNFKLHLMLLDND